MADNNRFGSSIDESRVRCTSGKTSNSPFNPSSVERTKMQVFAVLTACEQNLENRLIQIEALW
jgi:hypothetical protein